MEGGEPVRNRGLAEARERVGLAVAQRRELLAQRRDQRRVDAALQRLEGAEQRERRGADRVERTPVGV